MDLSVVEHEKEFMLPTQTGPLQLTDADMRIPHIISSQKWYSFRRGLQLRGSLGSLVGWGISTTSALLPIRCLRLEVPCTGES